MAYPPAKLQELSEQYSIRASKLNAGRHRLRSFPLLITKSFSYGLARIRPRNKKDLTEADIRTKFRLSSTKALSFSSACTMNRVPSSRCASTKALPYPLPRARARRGEHDDWGEPPPFWFVRLPFVESREKIDKNRTRDRTVVRFFFSRCGC